MRSLQRYAIELKYWKDRHGKHIFSSDLKETEKKKRFFEKH